MKKIFYIVVVAILTLGFTSCEKESAGLTQITYYAEIILEGDEQLVINKGSEYVEPGYKAVMAGEDVSNQVVVKSNVDTQKSGIYSILYSVTNADGFVASVSRSVIVLDLSDAIEGFWKVDVPNSQRIYQGGAPVAYKGAFEFLIINNGDGSYYVEDLFAGWYAQGAGYGNDYALEGRIVIATDGSISLQKSYVPGWGKSADSMTEGKYDADGKTISYKLFYGGVVEGTTTPTIEFDVTLEKIEL